MMNSDLSPRELETLNYIKNFFGTRKRMPTHKELSTDLNMSNNGFRSRILAKLAECGHLKKVVVGQIAYEVME